MAVTPTFLPFLPRGPYQTALTDPKTGIMSPAWVRWFQNLEAIFSGIWTDVAYAAANFTCVGVGATWNVDAADVVQFQTYQLGPFSGAFVSLITTTVSADTSTLFIAVPTLKMVVPTAAAFTTDAFTYPCSIFIDGVGETGYASLENVTAGGVTTVQIAISRISGSDFPLLAAAIAVNVNMLFQCQNVIVTA